MKILKHEARGIHARGARGMSHKVCHVPSLVDSHFRPFLNQFVLYIISFDLKVIYIFLEEFYLYKFHNEF